MLDLHSTLFDPFPPCFWYPRIVLWLGFLILLALTLTALQSKQFSHDACFVARIKCIGASECGFFSKRLKPEDAK